MAREIVLDTETTGLDPRQGHRLVEVACVELQDLLPTGRFFHRYINPEREIDPDAERVHGLSSAFLADKPIFGADEVAAAMVAFIGAAPVIAHNAAFDRGFVNAELERTGLAPIPEPQWIDSLAIARNLYPGMYNSLDALCKRFNVSLAEREKHGALIDARLTAAVYLELRGGREIAFDLSIETASGEPGSPERVAHGSRPKSLPRRITDDELAAHNDFISGALGARPLWLRGVADA